MRPASDDTAGRVTAPDVRRAGAARGFDPAGWVEHLASCAPGEWDPAVLNAVVAALNVDLDSAPAVLQRAGDLAGALARRQVRVEGAGCAAGLAALRKGDADDVAVRELQAVVEEEGAQVKAAALVGLVAALLRVGRYDAARRAAATTGHDGAEAPLLLWLADVASALDWLDGGGGSDPPVTAPDLAHGPRPEWNWLAPDAVAEARGRLALVAGDARASAAELLPLAERRRDRPELNYFAAWAALLCGDREEVRHCTERASGWWGRWAVVCVLAEVDAETAMEDQALASATGPFASVAGVRAAIGRGEPPGPITLRTGRVSVAEQLEAVRVAMGRALVLGDLGAFTEAAGSALFARLPLADAQLWRGLGAFAAGDGTASRTLLEAAAAAGHPRAALVLAADLLRSGDVQGASAFVEQVVAVRPGAVADVLLASADAAQGRLEPAVDRLEPWAHRNRTAAGLLAGLYVSQADGWRTAGRGERARALLEQASTAFEVSGAGAPDDRSEAALAAACVRLVVTPVATEAAEAAHRWPDVAALSPNPRARWIAWHLAVSALWAAGPDALAAAESAVALLEESAVPDAGPVAWLAQAIARALPVSPNGDAADPDRAAELAETGALLIDRLGRLANEEVIRPWAEIAWAKAARGRAREGSSHRLADRLARRNPSDPVIALVRAEAALRSGDRAGAVAVLQAGRDGDGAGSRVCRAVSNALADFSADTPAADGAPTPPEPALLLVAALEHAWRGDADVAGEAVLDAVRAAPGATTQVIDCARWLAPRLAGIRSRTRAPAPLLEALGELARSQALPPLQALRLARGAATVGDVDSAGALWEAAMAGGGEVRATACRELAAYLCHIAVKRRNRGDAFAAARMLRRAAAVVDGPA